MTKPELVTVGSGWHNHDIEAAFYRVTEGATWKKARTVCIMPAAAMIPTKVAMSHWCLMTPPNQPFFRMAALGQEVGDAYSNGIEEILANPELSQWEYLLTIEHDNTPPPDGLIKLVKRMDAHPEFACIGGLYWTKFESGVPQIWGDVTDPVLNFRPQPPRPGELVECYGTGMGFNLWRLSMFKDERLQKPWFRTIADATGVGTQDLSFWADARKYGYRCAVDCDVLVGHYDHQSGINW